MELNMLTRPQPQQNEAGFVLVAALMIMLVLSLIGIAMNRNTSTELQIAGNDKVHKQTFYEADGGTEFAAEVLEQNIACLNFAQNGVGSQWNTNLTTGTATDIVLDGNITVASGSLALWQNVIGTWSLPAGTPYPSDAQRDMWFPPGYTPGQPHTNIAIEGIADLATGSSIIQAAGYLGLGRSMSSGGVTLDYEIDSQHIGADNSVSLIRVEYRHVVGREDPFCKYD